MSEPIRRISAVRSGIEAAAALERVGRVDPDEPREGPDPHRARPAPRRAEGSPTLGEDGRPHVDLRA